MKKKISCSNICLINSSYLNKLYAFLTFEIETGEEFFL